MPTIFANDMSHKLTGCEYVKDWGHRKRAPNVYTGKER